MAKESKSKNRFFKDFKAELKKVIWPTPKQVMNSTIAVITIVLITAVIVFALDLTFDLFNNYGVNKLKQGIESRQNASEDTENQNKDETEGSEEDAENPIIDGENEIDGENLE